VGEKEEYGDEGESALKDEARLHQYVECSMALQYEGQMR
jgi:hypothetical protein